jgi:DNA-binding beta-propeller fold protein YncE|tara:strand:+ start:835 stop:1728 length:894 start_codon:yes stop_codon:yes gene_type:complete
MTIVGEGKFRYEVDRDWLRNKPAFWELGQCADVGVDSNDRIWLFSRSKHPVTCWTTDGQFIGSWGDLGLDKGEFRVPHGVFIDEDDHIWLADHQTHQVTKHNENGEVLLELGVHGYASITVTTVGGNGLPFNNPTGLAIANDGRLFVSDGYGNRRVHRFSSSGELEHSWGEAGTGPGQFSILHKVGVDKNNKVYICDRENNRIQIFDVDGNYLSEWNDVVGPGDIFFDDEIAYVVEQGGGNGISIWNLDGELITRWRGNSDACQAAHGGSYDSAGNIYVAEIGEPGQGQRVTKFSLV